MQPLQQPHALAAIALVHAEIVVQIHDLDRLASLVARSCALKAAVVSRDEREQGERMLLNLGHTFGHAIEKVQDYRGLEHGEAVAVGTVAAARLSVRLGVLDAASADEIAALLRMFRLPIAVSGCAPDDLLAAMAADKKAVSGIPRIVSLALSRVYRLMPTDRSCSSHIGVSIS